MKDEQKVWIRGVEGRGKEVIKTLEDRGGISVGEHGDCPWNIYFITHSGSVDYCPEDDETAKIIMDNYRELHLPEKWKDGDVLANVEFDDCFAVCKCKSLCNTSYNAYHCYMYADFRCGEIDTDGCNILHSAYRLATPSEVGRFHELLHKHGKEWDAEKKKLVEWRWKPDYHEFNYKIMEDGSMSRRFWNNDKADNAFFYFGNCFRTREEAEAMAEKIKKLLNGKRLSIRWYKPWIEPYKCFYLPHVSFHAGKEWGECEGKDYIMYYFFSFEFAFLKRHRHLYVELRTKMYDKWDVLPF